jgi:hypothetical protein
VKATQEPQEPINPGSQLFLPTLRC